MGFWHFVIVFLWVTIKVVDIILVLAGMYRTGTYIGIEMPIFCTSLNTSRFRTLPASTLVVSVIPANFGHYQPVSGVLAGTEKNLYLFIYF